jgi:2-polyprenyl-3-methyl-5-hydroxy-6-metoxy-1,4-benzoquinol methylase
MGIDISPEQVALAHAVGLEQEVVQGDMLALLDRANPDYYDVIILFDILEHFPPAEQINILDKVFTRLKSNGKCILHVPNAEGCFGSRILYSDISHKFAFTRRSMEQLLRTVGFEEIVCLEDKPIPHSLFSFVRRIIWEVVAMVQVIAIGSETGNIKRNSYILSQNMLTVAKKIDQNR